jgi:PAS domain S-box-containing protein
MSETNQPPSAGGTPFPQPRARPAGVSAATVHDAELRLRAIFDNAFHFMGLLTPSGELVEVNRAALDFAGLTAENAIGRPFWETGWWLENEREQERLREAVLMAAAGGFVRYEVELSGAQDDVTRTLDFSLKSVHDDDGNVVLLIAEARDVTEMMWAQRALRVSEAKFAGIVTIASDAIISVDENFIVTLFNRGAEAIFGYSADEMLGQPLDLLLPQRFRATHGRHMHNFAASPVAARRMGERQEILGCRKDGTEFPAEASISKLDLFGSSIFTVVLRDITDRKRIERSQRFLAQAGSILASSLDYEKTLASVAGLTVPELADWSVVYVREDDGSLRKLEVAHADPARRELVQQLLRYPVESPHPAMTVLETGAPELMADVGDAFIEAIAHTPEQLHIYRTLGMRSLLVVPLLAHGEVRGAMGFFSANPRRYGADELTLAQELALLSAMAVDNARLYRDARAAVQARDDMISVVSHDLGNPLSAIRIGTSLLLRSAADETARQHLEFIRQSAQQMESLVNDLLDVKRLESGSMALRTETVSIPDAMHNVMEVFRPIAQGRSITLECRLGKNLPSVSGDRQRLIQVLSNLVGNGLKFTEPGGSVTVEARLARDVVLFTVADTGSGIEAAHLPHVFDRFWQARREGRKGLGLGLAIARGVVEAHGGHIWAESTPGEGSTFLFSIPAALPESNV